MLLNQAESAPCKPRELPALTCPVCGFRFPLRKFNSTMKRILYPVQIVTGGGRAKGFHVLEYVPWEALSGLRPPEIWNSLLCLYARLGSAYDNFYRVLGFLSPEIKKLALELQRGYTSPYLTSTFPEYTKPYAPTESSANLEEAYPHDDYPAAYSQPPCKPTIIGGVQNE